MVSRRQRRQKKRQSRQRQTGGGWGFDGSTFAAAGAPIEVRSVTNDCNVPVRYAPVQLGGGCGCNKQIGGSCGLPQRGGSCGLPQRGGSCGLPQRGGGSCGLPQRGGSCGIQRGGGGGGGGYMVNVGSNDLGKVATYVPGSCPGQRGGNAIGTYAASYSVTEPVLLDSGARYLNVMAGQKAGSRRRRKAKRQTQRR
jgi:hypothetical protein